MLTRDLLRYQVSGGYAKPKFISAADPKLLDLAARMIAVYEASEGVRREDLEEELNRLTARWGDVKLARGLGKILADRAEFSSCAEEDYPAFRHAMFLRGAALLNSEECPEDALEFREKVLDGETVLKESVYPDLPENERLQGLKKTFPKELLERYNVSLAQSLLLFSEELECRLCADDPAALRRLFKYLKFFRLLFRAELDVSEGKKGKKGSETPPSGSMIWLKIDGPASILENSTRYGLQLASFFPALCSLRLWRISCGLKLRTHTLRLVLDESSKLVSHYTNFGAYVPEEFRMFQDYFNRTDGNGWKLIPREAYLKLEGNQLTFPDFRFRSESGAEADVELFHQWHRTPLTERIGYLEKHPETPLLLGADRACLKKDEELKARFENLRGSFLFTSFPGVENVTKALNKFISSGK